MKIEIIGGGPAGLYLAILMKRYDSRHEIRVHERGGPDDTFGWGVVFSGKTLSSLREADRVSHQRITKSFASWDGVHVVHRGERIVIRGNHFAGIARIGLLHILQERATELGVDIQFGSPIEDPSSLRDCDLLVGADGVGSIVRNTWADTFGPQLEEGRNRYIWLGTPQLFHGLSLTFCENDNGLFAAHSYKFDEKQSTFIVECGPRTWQNSGFEEMDDEATRTQLAEVFSEVLEGHPLLSNNSRWVRFLIVKNQRWSHENVVLVGDALRTAHFSIGSGTKLAMEDSIHLANSFTTESNVHQALEAYERKRKPGVEAYQAMARQSMLWFENIHELAHLEPIPFAYESMTRAGKINHEEMRKRDPEFIASYEQWRLGELKNLSKAER